MRMLVLGVGEDEDAGSDEQTIGILGVLVHQVGDSLHRREAIPVVVVARRGWVQRGDLTQLVRVVPHP